MKKSFKTHLDLLFSRNNITLSDYTDAELSGLHRWVWRFVVNNPEVASRCYLMINHYRDSVTSRIAIQYIIDVISDSRISHIKFMKKG